MASGDYICMDMTYEETMRLITAYKKQGILWNPHLAGFHHKMERDEAWRLVAVETGLEPDKCKKKIKSLTSSFRREKTRIIKSRQTGNVEDVVDPKWRYWNAFKFLRGLEDDEEDPLGTAPEMDILDPTLDPQKMRAKLKKIKYEKQESLSSGEQTDNSEISLGKTVAAKLRKMYPDQKLYAENLINQIIDKATVGQLTSHSRICVSEFENSALENDSISENYIVRSTNSTDVNSENFMLNPLIKTDSPESPGFESPDDLKPLSML